jgi:hypothetical protein
MGTNRNTAALSPEMAAFVQMARRSKPWQRRACAQMLRDLHDGIEQIISRSERDQQHDAERRQRDAAGRHRGVKREVV